MFKSLQVRLILSYILIIVVCLVLVGLAAIVLLRGYQRNLTYARLADRAVLAARLASQSLRQEMPLDEAVRWLESQLNRNEGASIFVYLLDARGRVVSGSNDLLRDQQFEDLRIRPAWPVNRTIRGERRLATGEQLLYVAEVVRAAGDDGLPLPPYVLLLAEPVRPARLALGSLLPRLLWAGAIALAISVVVAAVIAYSISRPLDRIARAAEEVAAGNYDQQLHISAPTEVARLAHSFNSMACQVQSTLRSQQDLVANVSHELKTPLTSIQGFSQALLDGTAGDTEARERAAAVIHEEAARMRRLVDDLLDLARLEAGQVELAREAVDIGDLLQANVVRFAPQLEQAGVELGVEMDPALPEVMGDADRLGQVFANLLDNAVKHAGEGGRVMLRAEQQDHHVVCSVTDNGPGIPADELARIFERFYQVDKSRVRKAGGPSGGAGLGLAIAQEIVQAHSGQIRAESVQGLGTRFTVELPAWSD